MLKCSIFIIVFILFETYNHSRIQCAAHWFDNMFKTDYHCYLDEEAEETFLAEEEKKAEKIEALKKKIRDAKAGLSFVNTATTLGPKISTSFFHFLWNGFKKGFQVLRDLGNIWDRDHGKTELKNEIKEQKKDALFNKWSQKGEAICVEAFKHQFFTEVKKWELVVNHPKTKAKDKLWIRVQTEYNHNQDDGSKQSESKVKESVQTDSKVKGGVQPETKVKGNVQPETKVKGSVQTESKVDGGEKIDNIEEEIIDKKKFWRPSKRCMAKKKEPEKGEPNKPFEVFISAAQGFKKKQYKIFIFLRTDREKLDYWNKWIFFWQRVVHVVGYTWS